MTQYAKYISETSIQYPQASDFIGVPHWETHDILLRRKGFVPLTNIPENREGFQAVLDRFSFTQQTVTRIEPRREDPVTHAPFMEDIMEEDPETHEMKKVGERQVTREVPVEFDDSYITVLEFHYIELPPPPEPEQPDTTERDAAEKKIVGLILQLASAHDAINDIVQMQDITIPNLESLAISKGVATDSAEWLALIASITPLKWQLEAIEDTTWAQCWQGLKSRFPAIMQEILAQA